MKRVVIIGNSGSGKSFLAKRMSAPTGTPVIELDRLVEEPGPSEGIRSLNSVRAEVEAIKQRESWIVEGVAGELAELFLDRADYLIWLDLPWLTCREGLYASASQSDAAQVGQSLEERLARAEGYWQRTDRCSYAGHQEIFDEFAGHKDRIVFHGCAEALWDD
ncbi:hypothetical protein BH09VER1_BH09VER1_10640 [soil metagenome]